MKKVVTIAALFLAKHQGPSDPTIRVGILHSLTGTMAISEVTVKDEDHEN